MKCCLRNSLHHAVKGALSQTENMEEQELLTDSSSSGVVQKSMMRPGPWQTQIQGRWQCRRGWTSCAKSGQLRRCPFKKMLCIAEVVGYLGYLPVLCGFCAFHKVLVRSVLWLIALDIRKRAHWPPFSLSQLNSRIWWEKHLKQHKAAALARGAQRPSKHRVGSGGACASLPTCGIRTGTRAHVARPNEIGFQTLLLTFKMMKLSSCSY